MGKQKRSEFQPKVEVRAKVEHDLPAEVEEYSEGVLKRQEGTDSEHFKYTIKQRRNGFYYLEGTKIPRRLSGEWPRLDRLKWEIHLYEFEKSSYYRNNSTKHVVKE